MRKESGKILAVVGGTLMAAAIVASVVIYRIQLKADKRVTIAPASMPTSHPASNPATAPVAPPPIDLLGVVRENNPRYPTTRELDMPGNYDQAAHIVLNQPVYLCPQGHLWITDPHAVSTQKVLANLGEGNSHIVPDRIVFAHWQQSEAGKWTASVVRQNSGGGFDLVQAKRVTPLPGSRKWLWDRAMAWEDKIIAPSEHGVSIFSVNDPANELYQSLIDDAEARGKTTSPPVVLFDTSGILTWMPWESGLTGSHGAARFVDGKWTRLDASQGWPDKILQLMPLLDGSILELVPEDDGSIKLQMSGVARDTANVNENDIQRLVEQLSDPDQVNRDAAYEQLTRYGPGALPILEKLQDNQPPAAQSRIAELL
ncbi:MAG TPA: hypothetical protein VHS31_11915, partial [Tepidisphaeraceae bacterium]|nr:hypothetical protein [Tepidisphaeraceae bacterium]